MSKDGNACHNLQLLHQSPLNRSLATSVIIVGLETDTLDSELERKKATEGIIAPVKLTQTEAAALVSSEPAGLGAPGAARVCPSGGACRF